MTGSRLVAAGQKGMFFSRLTATDPSSLSDVIAHPSTIMAPPSRCPCMSRFRPIDRKTEYPLPPSQDDWLPEDHLARFILGATERAVEKLLR